MYAYDVSTLRALASRDHTFAAMLADFNAHGALTAAQVQQLNGRPVQAAQQQALPLQAEVSAIERAIAHAKSKGVTQPIIRAFGMNFMPADPQRAQPVNRDAIFITAAGERGAYLGKILRGQVLPSAAATRLDVDNIQLAVRDPLEAAVRYGRETGRCSICDRTLSNPESIKLGIGPICRSKFGWA